QLSKSRKVISVHVRPERNPAKTHDAKPIEFSVECQVLENPKQANEETQSHEKPDKPAPVVPARVNLRHQKQHDQVSDQELQFNARVIARSCQVEYQLRDH